MLNCGMSEVIISPPIGSPIPGAVHDRHVTGIKDELYAKSLVIETDQQQIAFVTLDAIDIPRDVAQAIRKRTSEKTGIQEKHITVTCTHAHTTGPTIETTFVKAVDPSYHNWIIQKSVDAITLAYNLRQEAKIGYGLGQEQDIAFNRRFYMKDGTVRTNPGIGNPDIVEPTGPIDPDVAVIRIDDSKGRPIGVVTNFSCHADTVGGTEISADFPGELSRSLKRIYGDQLISLFWQGASGNINHIDVNENFPIKGGQHHLIMGRILAGEVMGVREKITLKDEVALHCKSAYVPIQFRKPTSNEVESALDVLGSTNNKETSEVKLAQQAIQLKEREDEVVEVEIQVIVLGNVAIVNLPAEIFVEFGLQIKHHSPFPLTIVNELCNGSVSGYVCTQEAYTQSTGYENRLRKYSRLQIDAGDLFVQQALLLLNEYKATQQ